MPWVPPLVLWGPPPRTPGTTPSTLETTPLVPRGPPLVPWVPPPGTPGTTPSTLGTTPRSAVTITHNALKELGFPEREASSKIGQQALTYLKSISVACEAVHAPFQPTAYP